eukprot:7070171-Alexandrium_andersonii.AAC.1
MSAPATGAVADQRAEASKATIPVQASGRFPVVLCPGTRGEDAPTDMAQTGRRPRQQALPRSTRA